MPIDPDDPPIWLRMLHVTAEQLSPDEYPATPAEGILQVCRLSNAQRKLIDLGYLWSWAERLGLQSELHYVLISAMP